MRTMGKMDASIQGWYIDPTEVSICKRPEDGEDWLLGTGSYGKVGSPHQQPHPFAPPARRWVATLVGAEVVAWLQ
jgi:hypothetical protein